MNTTPAPGKRAPARPVLRLAAALLCACPLLLASLPAAAQYPARPIRIVVPIAPGGGTDIFARLMSTELAQQFGQPVLVENMPGAGNIVGIRNVIAAPPDGYRLLFTSNTVTIDQSVKIKPEFDLMRDLAPIANVVNGVYVLMVSTRIPSGSLADFVAWARANPGKVNYGSTGLATTGHLISEEFARVTGTRLFHIPYGGVAPANTAFLAGDIDMLWNDALLSMPAVKSGKARILVVGSRTRSPILPEVPTMIEAGHPGFEAAFKFGYFAPAGTPRPIIDRLNTEILAALKSPRIRSAAEERGWELAGTSPEGYKRMLEEEVALWARVVREAKIEKQ